MSTQYFISDTHFGHAGIVNFTRNDGSPLRPFTTIEEHDEHLVEQWNKIVKPQDKVYHLGDVVINRRCLPILERLNGKKRLIRGNHDIFKTEEYSKYFDEILAYRVFGKEQFICSHIPIHPESLSRWKANVHGHLHANTLNDPRYVCICVEQTDYKPICMDELLQRFPK